MSRDENVNVRSIPLARSPDLPIGGEITLRNLSYIFTFSEVFPLIIV